MIKTNELVLMEGGVFMQILIILALVYFAYIALNSKTDDEQRSASAKFAEWICRLYFR